MLDIIYWNADPVIFSLGPVAVRWYGLAFAIGFIAGYSIVARMFKHEGAPEKWLGILLMYLMAGTVVGLAEKGGRNVAASREKQMCRCVCSPGIQAGKKGNIQLYQGVFVVFCAFRAACNEYG